MLASTILILLLTIAGALGELNFKKKFEAIDYGIKVDVDGLKMDVGIVGEGNEPTIVLLPGLNIVSPVISYKAFAETLSDKFRVITVEPFGYGISDNTKKERINENIVSELHTCLQNLVLKSII